MKRFRHIKFEHYLLGLFLLIGSMGSSIETYAQTSKEYTDAEVTSFVTDLQAGTYDTLVLSTSGGVYDINSPSISTSIVIMGKEGLESKPIFKNTANTSASFGIFKGSTVTEPNTITFYNLEFEGTGATAAPLLILSLGETKIVVKDCYLHDFTNSNGIFRLNGAGSSFEMKNTIVSNAKQRIVHAYTTGNLYGDISIENSTFTGITAGGIIFFRSAGGAWASGNDITINHCTFNDVTGDITRYDATNMNGTVSVTNSIFNSVTGDLDADVIDYNYVDGLGTVPGGATNSITTAPVFADVANLNFALTNKDEMVGSDFQTLGDLSYYTDDVPPVVFEELVKVDQTHLMVQFNEVVNPLQVTSTANYTLSGTGGLTGNPLSVARQVNGKDAILTVDDLSGMVPGQNVIVTVSNIADLNGNVIVDNNVATYTLLDEVAPIITMAEQTVTNDPGQTVKAQSNELGLIYMVLSDVTQSNLEELEAAFGDGLALKDTIEAVDTDLVFSVEGAKAGTYFAYAVDEFNNISLKSVDSVIVTDITVPELTMIAQEVANSSIDEVFAMSNETGMIYLVLDGEAQSTVAELEVAVVSGKGFCGSVSMINEDITLSPEGVEVGTYYGYAVDAVGNISTKSANAVVVSQYVPRVRYYEDTEADLLSADIIAAIDGDVFVLTTSGGNYNMAAWANINAKITLMADENLAEKPVVNNLKESNTTQIFRFSSDGSGLNAKGIIFDSKSREAGSYPLKYAIRSNADIGGYSLVLDDCEFRGSWMSNDASAGCAIRFYNGTFADSIIIKNCIFDGDEGIVINSSTGPHTWGKFEISNCTFMNIPDDQAIQIVQKGEDKILPFIVNHCTFYNVGGVDEFSIQIDSLYNASITNSIFANSTADTSFHIFGDATNKGMVDYSNFYECPQPLTDEGGMLGTSIWTDDPQFADAVNSDLTLGNADMLAKGNDGLPLGDLRWADIFGPEVVSSMTARSDSTLLLEFNEWIDTTTAIVAANYTLSGSAGYTGNVKSAELYNFRSVLLTVQSFANKIDDEIVVTVSNVTDLKGNVVDASSNVATYTVEEFRPVVTADAQAVTNGDGQVVLAQSNQGTGYLYVILDGEPQSTYDELEAAVTALKGAKVQVTASYIDMMIDVSGIEPGSYFAYAIDAANNVSDKGANEIVVTDGILPILTCEIQAVSNAADAFILAQSNELGTIYIILDGEPQETVNDLISSRYNGTGAGADVVTVDSNVQVSTKDLTIGIYYAYAVDLAGNMSLKGTNPINITQATTGVNSLVNEDALIYSASSNIIIKLSDNSVYNNLVVSDMLGKQITKQEINSNNIELTMNRVGLYLVTLYNNSGVSRTTKVIIR